MDTIPLVNPSGLCQCGCGQKTVLASRNHKHCGYTVGESIRFIFGHRSRLAMKQEPSPLPDVPVSYCACGCGGIPGRLTKSTTGYKRGDYYRFIKCHNLRKTPHEYVEEDRGYSSPCWIWTRGVTSAGYGMASGVAHKNKQAHRVYYERTYGPIGDGLFVDHLCGNKACVNPGHLEAVAPRENTRRSKALLTTEQVVAIRESTASHAELSRHYGVSDTTIRDIRTGRTWKDLSLLASPKWSVYALADPQTGVIRYIGKSNDVAVRYRAHLKPTRSAHSAVASWVRFLRTQGRRPALITLSSWETDTEARAAEREMISYYRTAGTDLLNNKRGSTAVPEAEEGRSSNHRFRKHPEEQLRGEAVGTAILTESQVRVMRDLYDGGGIGTPTLARMFGVTTSTAHNVIKRHTWKHVE